jgi:hypothetical protein
MTDFYQNYDPQRVIGFLGLVGLVFGGLWFFMEGVGKPASRPEPWDSEVTAQLEQEEATPLCHHCLLPQNSATNFCPQCGAPVGPYTNLLPYTNLFSVGHMLRIGTGEQFQRTPFKVAFFMLVSLSEYGPFAPFYWYRLFTNRNRINPAAPEESLAAPTTDSDAKV